MPKRPVAPLVNGRVRLRLIEEADLPLTRAWRNRDHIRKWFINSDVIVPERHQAWYQQYRDRDDDFVFIVEETETLKRPVGQIALYNVDWVGKRAEVGRMMIGEPEARGLGLARLAVNRLVGAAFDTFGLDEAYLDVLANNAPAISLYTACGFEESHRHAGLIRMQIERKPS